MAVDLQNESDTPWLPKERDFEQWTQAALRDPEAEVCIRIVDEEESAQLNAEFRRKRGPTNVLSFGAEVPYGVQSDLLGDLVICAPLVRKEAAEQNKQEIAHWAHLTIHGCLHLQGFDHTKPMEARRMESLEIDIMAGLGFPNPYLAD